MARRVSLDVGALLAALLLVAPFASAEVCDTVQLNPQDYLRFLNAIYSTDGITTLQTFHDIEKPPVASVSRDSTAIVNEQKGMYHSVEFEGKQAVDTKVFTPFFEEMVINGPFFIIGVLDDTLRVSKGSAAGYAYDKGLNERFEGRMEYANFGEAAGALTEMGVGFLKQVFVGNIGSEDRVVNVLRSRDFSVTTTCASNGCSQEMYSLFTKYLNIGASAQMILELGGGAVWNKIVPNAMKAKVQGAATRIQTSISKPISGLKNAILDGASGLDDSTKQLLRGTDELPGITDPSFSYKRLDDIPLKEKGALLQYLTYVDSTAERASRLADEIIAVLQTEGKIVPSDSITDLAQRLDDLDDAFSRIGANKVRVVEYLDGGNKKVYEKSLKEFAKSLRENASIDRSELDTIKTLLATTTNNTSLAAKHLSGQVPIIPTMSGLIEDTVVSAIPGYDKGSLAMNYTVKPLVYYIVKRGPLAHRSDPFASTGAYHIPSFSWPSLAGAGFKLPDTWKVGVMYPPKSGTYVDSFVDVLINNGSDPGDAFKSLITLSGGKIVVEAVKLAIGKEIPTGGIILSDEMEKTYKMGPAVVAFGVAADECPACSFRGYGYALTFTGPAHVPAFGSVVEDTNALSEGSTAIVFGHHVDMNSVDASLDTVKAEVEGRSCYDTCPLLANSFSRAIFGNDPSKAMFAMSAVQSLSAVFGFTGVGLVTLSMYVLTEGCYDCVDTFGGYYVHLRVPPQQASQEVFEVGAGDALTTMLDAAGSVLGSVSDALESEVNAFKKKVIAENIQNQGAYIQFHMNGLTHGELRVAKLIELWMKPDSMVPSEMSDKGGLAGESKDGKTVKFDKRSGVMSVNGAPLVENEYLLRMMYVDNSVPGIVVPTWAIVAEFTSDPAFEATKGGYVIKDQAFLECFASHVPGGSPDNEFFHEVMGDVVAIRAELGSIDFTAENIVGVTRDWSGIVYNASIGSDYNVSAKIASYSVESEGNGMEVDVETGEKPFGQLKAVIFENGAVYRWGGKLFVQIRRIVSVPGSYVESIDISPAKDGMAVSFAPTPDAPDDVRKRIDRLNKAIDEMGGINTIFAEDGAVAIFRDENGELWLRIFDKNALQSMTVKDAYAILHSVLSGDGKHSIFEVLDGSLRIYREGGSLYLSYLDRTDGTRKKLKIKSFKQDDKGYVLETEEGQFVVSLREKDGVVIAALNGVVCGPVIAPGAVTQKKILDMYKDPNTGDLVVETEDGTHRIRVGVDSRGNPQLYIDDVLKGIVQFMQGPKGYVAYDPDTGEWSLVAGLLTPLAESFKDGIKISLNSNGQLAATPAAWNFRPNPYTMAGGQGLSLPLFGGPEIVLLLIAMVAVFVIIR